MIDNNTSHINNPGSFYDGLQNDEQEIRGIITDLKLVINHISMNFTKASELIHRLARRLDESKQCERDQICKRIYMSWKATLQSLVSGVTP